MSTDIKIGIETVLRQAAHDLLADPEIQSGLCTASKNVGDEVYKIIDTLSVELAYIFVRRRLPTQHHLNTAPVITSNIKSQRYPIYVVVPVCNATDDQAYSCINSVLTNFCDHNIALLTYTNRPLKTLPHLVTTNISYVEFYSPTFSLPHAYNACIDYLRREMNVHEEVIVFMDDDATIADGQQHLISHNLNLVKDTSVMAVSGHYYDETEPKSFFEKAIHLTHTSAFAKACTKPYCHGGAALMLRAKHFPQYGLPYDGLGGISLNTLLIKHKKVSTLQTANWFLHNNADLRVLHPRKKNIVQWSATYLSYALGWNRALSLLDSARRKLWIDKLSVSSESRKRRIIADIKHGDSSQSREALANLLITKYYKPLLSEHFSYDAFKGLDVKTHCNLGVTT